MSLRPGGITIEGTVPDGAVTAVLLACAGPPVPAIPGVPPARHSAEVVLPCGDARRADLVRRAIQAEADEAPEGAACRLSVDGGDLKAAVTAADVAGLRAALNTVVRLADAALRTAGGGAPAPPDGEDKGKG